jgi:hypothetical protein
MLVKLTIHTTKSAYVVNTLGSYLQRQPRTYSTRARAMERVDELMTEIGPNARLQIDER